jgi:hypothetical protein
MGDEQTKINDNKPWKEREGKDNNFPSFMPDFRVRYMYWWINWYCYYGETLIQSCRISANSNQEMKGGISVKEKATH